MSSSKLNSCFGVLVGFGGSSPSSSPYDTFLYLSSIDFDVSLIS